MEEYSKRKEAIKEDLRRQYEQILKDNQRIADLRTDKERDEEVKDQELRAAVAELEESPEQAQAVLEG
jgi:hypothetical protein